MSDTILSPMNLCPKCQNANPEASKFCIQCGTPLSKSAPKPNFTISLLNSNDKEEKSIQVDKSYDFSQENDFPGLKSEKGKLEIKLEKGKLFIKDMGSSGIYLKISNSNSMEISPGQEFILNGKHFKIS